MKAFACPPTLVIHEGCWSGRTLRDELLADDAVRGAVATTVIDDALDPQRYLGMAGALVDRAKAGGLLRADVSDADISLMMSCLLPPSGLPHPQRLTIAGRYLEILLDGLHAGHSSPLPGKPFTQDELDSLFLS